MKRCDGRACVDVTWIVGVHGTCNDTNTANQNTFMHYVQEELYKNSILTIQIWTWNTYEKFCCHSSDSSSVKEQVNLNSGSVWKIFYNGLRLPTCHNVVSIGRCHLNMRLFHYMSQPNSMESSVVCCFGNMIVDIGLKICCSSICNGKILLFL